MSKDTLKPSKMLRETYDLSCYNAVCGRIGYLQTIFTLPTYANDTISINMVGALRLSELKRYLTIDCKVDLFAFHVKHRHIYGDDWVTMIKNGMQDSTTLGTDTAVYRCESLGGCPAGTIPKAYNDGYWSIWNNYFRIPNVTPSDYDPTTALSTTISNAASQVFSNYGFWTARLPSFWNTGIPAANIDAYDQDEVPASAGSGAINLLDLAEVQAQYTDDVDLEWFAHRYRDVLANKHGSNGVTIDADDRPELLMHQESWLSGYDVDGTDAASLGNYKGKSQGTVTLRMPPKYFNEHGMIWVMAVLRFPSILEEEVHYLMHHTWDYDTITGDPNVWSIKPPVELTEDDFHGEGGSDSWGYHPYGQWARTQPNHVHNLFHLREGFPFVSESDINVSVSDNLSYDTTSWSDYFGNEDLGSWNLICKAEIEAKRNIPAARTSLYAGGNLR